MATVSELSASLSEMSASISRWTEMLQQMNAILARMNGVSSASSSSSTASATSAPTTTATTPAAPPTPAAPSAASTTTSPKSFAPTPATTPSSARATAVVPTPYAPTTASTPPTTAVAIFFRLPTPDYLTAKKKIAKKSVRALLSLAVGQEASLSTRARRTSVFPIRTKAAGVECPSERKKAPTTPRSKAVRPHRRPPRRGRPPRLQVQGLGMRPQPRRRALRHGNCRRRRRRRLLQLRIWHHLEARVSVTPKRRGARRCSSPTPAPPDTLHASSPCLVVATKEDDCNDDQTVVALRPTLVKFQSDVPKQVKPLHIVLMAATSQSTSAPLGVQLGFDGLLPRYTPLLDVLLFGCCQMNIHYTVPWPPPDRTWYAYCQVQHWGLVQKIGIHLWDSGIALSYFAVDARETHNVFESKGDVQQNPPGPPPICSCLAAHRLNILPLPWPPDPCEMIVDSGIPAYSILALTDCHCMSEAGGGVSRSFLIHTTLPPLVQSTFFSGIFQPFRNSQLSVWVTSMASMGQQVFDRGKYMEAIFMQLLLQARANPNTPAELRRLPMGLVVLCKCKDEVELRLPKLFDKMQSDVLVLLTISWPPPTWSGSSVLGTIKPFLNLHEFWQQRHVHLQFTGLPSLCISELKPRPPPTGMRNELLQVDRTSVYRSYGMLAQNTINQAAMFVWRQEWCGFQNNCYYLEQILIWCLLLCTAKGRCWKVASSWQCKTSNQEQVLAEISDCRGDEQAVNEFHLLGSEYCSTILEHLIFIFLVMTKNSSVKDNSNPLPNTAYASALLIKQQEQLLQQYKLGNSQRLQRQQHGQQLYIKGAAMVVDDDMPPVELLRTRCQLSKLDVAFWLQGDAGCDGNAPPVIAVLACAHACYSKLQFYNLMIEDP